MMLSDVCRVHLVGGRRVRPASWMVHIGWWGPARPAWLRAATPRCRASEGDIVAAARLQLVMPRPLGALSDDAVWRLSVSRLHWV